MATHGTPPKKNAERQRTGVPQPSPAAATPSGAAASTAPTAGTGREPETGTEPETAAAAPAAGEASAVRNAAAARRLRRRLLTLKATIYVLVAGCLVAIGLTIRQVTLQPVLAGVYVGLASVGVAGIGVCVTVYLHIRRRDGSDS
ncbi:hypothetical protein [Streptomyces aurantiogriseus]|uniref:Uncharacterized protein n=1 Tax=Streptomyces aurantiogriseus TaxID=66870 RepID=A0A918F2T5_9ACTN|nr:hypothetical protein [Streptomyces aurantiogriseus]GGQ95901.1 hypothetical protein GCM10010251_08210 [Streptomyces aurantiogriseus]